MNRRVVNRIFRKFKHRPTPGVVERYLAANVRLAKLIHLGAPDSFLDDEQSLLEGYWRVLAARGLTPERVFAMRGVEVMTAVPVDKQFVFTTLPWIVRHQIEPSVQIVMCTAFWRTVSVKPPGKRAVILFTD